MKKLSDKFRNLEEEVISTLASLLSLFDGFDSDDQEPLEFFSYEANAQLEHIERDGFTFAGELVSIREAIQYETLISLADAIALIEELEELIESYKTEP